MTKLEYYNILFTYFEEWMTKISKSPSSPRIQETNQNAPPKNHLQKVKKLKTAPT